MKSIDTYLCKEKKEVPAFQLVNVNSGEIVFKECTISTRSKIKEVEASVKKQNEYNEQYRNNRENNNGHWLLGSLFSWWPF